MIDAMESSACTGGFFNWPATALAAWASGRGSLSRAVQAGLLLALSAISAHAAERTVLLNFTCASYDSARRVALAQGWEGPARLPADCRRLAGQRKENRMATIVEIIEVLRLRSGRWVAIGRVRQLYGAISYSAGFAEEPSMI